MKFDVTMLIEVVFKATFITRIKYLDILRSD